MIFNVILRFFYIYNGGKQGYSDSVVFYYLQIVR